LVYFLVLLIPDLYIILFWEFYFLPFSVHVQTYLIYYCLCYSGFFKQLLKFFIS
jgi:hypothetical protein